MVKTKNKVHGSTSQYQKNTIKGWKSAFWLSMGANILNALVIAKELISNTLFEESVYFPIQPICGAAFTAGSLILPFVSYYSYKKMKIPRETKEEGSKDSEKYIGFKYHDKFEYRELPAKPIEPHNGSFDVIDARTGSKHQSSDDYNSLDDKIK